MNLADLHTEGKKVSTAKLNETNLTSAIAIRILENGIFEKHITKVPAILTLVIGKVTYETEKGEKIVLFPGDFVRIEPNVVHWLIADLESQLILMK
jgi:quercetin dioxygenase-like cupin family protein